MSKLKRLALVILAPFLIWVSVSSVNYSNTSYTVYAITDEQKDTTNIKPFVIVDSDSGVAEVVSNINSQITKELAGVDKVTEGWKFMEFDSKTKKVSLDKQVYSKQMIATRRKIMDIALDNLSENKSAMGKRDRARVYSFVENQDEEVARVLQATNTDIHADVEWASRYVRYWKSPINNALGILVILVCIMVGLSIAIDVFVMCSPPMMAWLLEKYKSGRPKFISPEAWYSYREAVTSDTYKDYMSKYLLKSIPKIVVTGICLSYIVVGNIVYIAIFFAQVFGQ